MANQLDEKFWEEFLKESDEFQNNESGAEQKGELSEDDEATIVTPPAQFSKRPATEGTYANYLLLYAFLLL